ncbi:MAG: sulfotransferase [Planctomycetota bacterium]|nr:sulfotransferase [Planctomycetota bacterium]
MLPTFLGIGSMRCGTTWLHEILARHPQIRMTDAKEPSFFDRTIIQRGLRWYERLFDPRAGEGPRAIRGEISPGYCTLSRREVEFVHRLLPAARIILVLRNPIERTWSQAVYQLGRLRFRTFDEVPVMRFTRHFDRRRTRQYNDYERMLDTWTPVYGGGAMHVAVYEELGRDPAGYVRAVLRHIGADDSRLPDEEMLANRVRATQSLEMPEVIRWYLAHRYRASIERLNARLDGRLEGWVQSMEGVSCPSMTWRLRRAVDRAWATFAERVPYAAFEQVRRMRRRAGYRAVSRQRAGEGRWSTPPAAVAGCSRP